MAYTINSLIHKPKIGTPLTILLIINIAIFVSVHLISWVTYDSTIDMANTPLLRYFVLGARSESLLSYPWTLLSYMFTQYAALHFLFNILCLYIAASILKRFVPQRFIVPLYIIGGLGGALFFLAFYNAIPSELSSDITLEGSSASILCMIVFATLVCPAYKFSVFNIGEISLRWITACLVLVDIIGLAGNNSGGHIAHIGGEFTGVISYIIFRIFFCANRSSEKPVDIEFSRILAKVRRSGYSSLNSSERQTLIDNQRN